MKRPRASRSLDRREALTALGIGALGLAAVWRTARAATGRAAKSCVLAPQQIEGPFYVADAPSRRDITEGRPGVALRVRLIVQDATTCARLEGADVELWHCDADGVYSGVNGPNDDTIFLRGHQVTDRRGKAVFDTIYPGWYTGRTPHIHVKVHVGGGVVHTGQLYFSDTVSSAVYRRAPYAARGAADTTNATDFIYASGGDASRLTVRKRGKGFGGRLPLGVRV